MKPRALLVRAARTSARGGHPRHCHPPLELFQAAAGLGPAGWEVEVVDLWLERGGRQLEKALARRPRVVVIAGRSDCLVEAGQLAGHSAARGALVVGVGQQIQPGSQAAKAWDLAVPGEYALVLPSLLEALVSDERRALDECHQRLRRNQPYLIENPDELPSLDVEAWSLEDYPFPLPVGATPVQRWGYVQTTWGCPYACLHCTELVRKSSGSRLRRRSPARVVEDIAAQLAAGAEAIIFEDDTLFCSPAHLRALCAAIEARELDFPWVANARPDELQPDLVQLAASSGARLLKLGIESPETELVKNLGKHRGEASWQSLCEQGLALLDQAGIDALALMLVGLPGQERAQVRATAAWLCRQPLDYLQVQVFTRYPDVQLEAGESRAAAGALYHYPVAGSDKSDGKESTDLIASSGFAESQDPLASRYPSPAHVPAPPHSDSPPGVSSYRHDQQLLYWRFYLRPGFWWRHVRKFWRWYLRGSRWALAGQQTAFVLARRRPLWRQMWRQKT